MKVLITGGAGFIGSHLAQRLLVDGHDIRIIDSLSPQIHGDTFHRPEWMNDSRVELIKGSVTVRNDMECALDGITHLVHLAAETGTGQSMYQIERYYDVNCQGTALLFDILANAKHRTLERVVLASSRSVYGEGAYLCSNDSCGLGVAHRHMPGARTAARLKVGIWNPECKSCGRELQPTATHEDDATSPASIYAATKLAQEDTVRIACASLGIGYAVLRLQNVYGEGQSLNNPYTGIISIFSTRIRRSAEISVFEDGAETRDFVHVADVVRAMRSALTSERAINDTVNVGSGIGTPVLDIAKLLNRQLGSKSAVRVSGEYRLGDIRHNFADVTRLEKLLRCKPKVSLDEGLSRFCRWVVAQPLPEDKLERANAELKERKLMG